MLAKVDAAVVVGVLTASAEANGLVASVRPQRDPAVATAQEQIVLDRGEPQPAHDRPDSRGSGAISSHGRTGSTRWQG